MGVDLKSDRINLQPNNTHELAAAEAFTRRVTANTGHNDADLMLTILGIGGDA